MQKIRNRPDRKITYIYCALAFQSTVFLVTRHAKASYRGGSYDLKGDPAIVIGVWIGLISLAIFIYYINSLRRYCFDVKYITLVVLELFFVVLTAGLLSQVVPMPYVLVSVLGTVTLFWYERKYFKIKYLS